VFIFGASDYKKTLLGVLDETALKDRHSETDEMFQNAGEKRRTPQKQG
jgi:hypothetical protein